ncbi:hydroxyacid dehydrogenase [Streptomyces sp. NBS 14/10]|uniref:hydroxyacid dehydrogenase n=1 Tax=Streptomyces sp. NBS 14/10 TaxID=1945643 RepID=UPI000B7F2DC4|nr:hydroxyacid dehydrogenase [Streptomyces sp. NBS 14/10]KAK1185328.1 hydroxyacid dehydrogenase [Streptomyces sp. NBS 14/10]
MVSKLAVVMTPERAADVCGPDARRLIEEHFEATWAEGALDDREVARLAAGCDVLLTSWGTPHLDASLWADGGGPKVVAHAAGTVKKLIDRQVLDQGVTVFSAAGRIAWSVGEYCLAAMLTLARRLPRFDAALRGGGWKQKDFRGGELAGRSVGIVGASSTARALITLLKPFGCEVLVYDPYLDETRAAALGVRTATLAETLRCAFVSLHVPDLPATRGMVTRQLIEAMPDGTIVVNSSRGPAIDQPALLDHVLSGRLLAALDVYDPEPPSFGEPVLSCPNLLLTPHIAGDTTEGHLALAGYVLADVVDWLDKGVHGPSHVDPAAWPTAA